jgi:hypothetical protein
MFYDVLEIPNNDFTRYKDLRYKRQSMAAVEVM